MLKQIVIVEGLSHCGKTSVINELKKKLDHKVLVLNTPNKNDLDEIEEYFIAKLDSLDPEKDRLKIDQVKYFLNDLGETKSRIGLHFHNIRERCENHNYPKQFTVEDYKRINTGGADVHCLALFPNINSILTAKTLQLKTLVDLVNLFDQEVTIIVDRFIGSTLVYSPFDVIHMANNPKDYEFRIATLGSERDLLLGTLSRVNIAHNLLKYIALTHGPVIPIFIECPVEERARRAKAVEANDESDKAFDEMSLELDTIMSRKYREYMFFFAEDCACFNPDVYGPFAIPSTTVEDTTKDILDILENKDYYKSVGEVIGNI